MILYCKGIQSCRPTNLQRKWRKIETPIFWQLAIFQPLDCFIRRIKIFTYIKNFIEIITLLKGTHSHEKYLLFLILNFWSIWLHVKKRTKFELWLIIFLAQFHIFKRFWSDIKHKKRFFAFNVCFGIQIFQLINIYHHRHNRPIFQLVQRVSNLCMSLRSKSVKTWKMKKEQKCLLT